MSLDGRLGNGDGDGDGDGDGIRVELWVREWTPYGAADRVGAVHERLRRLEGRGAVADVDVHVWGRSISIADGTAPTPDAPGATVDEFVSWARREGYSLEPAFEIRKRESELDPRTDTVLTLPLVCVALYDDGDLVAVFPHATNGVVRGVEDCLERLDRERVAQKG